MLRQPATIIFGGTRIGNRDLFKPSQGLEQFLAILSKHGVAAIDTAQAYGESEGTLGTISAAKQFTIDTKWSPPSWTPDKPWASKDDIIRSAESSIQKLGSRARIFYLHKPDPLTPISETLAGVNQVFNKGLFQRFGLSGFPPTEVEAVFNHCAEQGYPLPTVYQGSYNPLNRHKETGLFPTLRKLGISFYAFGPSAGGFLGKTVAEAESMATGGAYISATCRPYVKDARYLDVLGGWNSIAEAEGIGAAELAYRWMAYHSALDHDKGDALIIGASSHEQLEETLSGIAKGPLGESSCEMVQKIWENLVKAGL